MQTPDEWPADEQAPVADVVETEAFEAVEMPDGTTVVEQVDVQHADDGSLVTTQTEA